MKKLDRRLVRLINHSKGQFVAIASVIILGIMIYVAMNSAYINLDISLKYHYETHSFADVFSEVIKISENAVEDLNDISGVAKAEGRVTYDVPLKTDDQKKVNVRIVSSPYAEDSINRLHAVEGKNILTNDNECLLIEKFAQARNIQIGDTITPHILGRDYELQVVGIVSSPEYVYLMENEQTLLPDFKKFGVVYTTESLAQDAFGLGSNYNQVMFRLEPDLNVDEMVNLLEKKMDRYGVSRIYPQKDQLSNRMIGEEMKGLEQMASVVPVVFLGVAALIMGIMINRLVKGDRVTIGILKSMGYSNWDVMLHYTKLSVIIGLAGGFLGVAAGYMVSIAFTDLYGAFFSIPTLKFVMRLDILLWASILTGMFSVLAGVFGARRAMGIAPAESMRPEPPKTGKRIWLEGTKMWKYFNFSNKMVARNMLRNKKRIIFVAFGVAVTYSIILMPFFMLEEFTNMFDVMFGEFQTMDYNMNFSQGVEDSVLYDLKNRLDVDAVEGKVEFPFELRNQWKTKVVNVIGLQENSQFFNFKDRNFQPVDLGPGDLFLNEGLARVLSVEEGDYIMVETYIPGRDDIELRVTKIIKQNLGSNAYMNIEDMQRLFLDDQYITGAYVDTDKNIKEAVDNYRIITSVQSLGDLRDTFTEFLELTIASLVTYVFLGGIMGFAVVYNSTIMNINERRLEFSSLRVMGFTKNEIFVGLLKENLINGLIGIIVGIPMGDWMIKSIADQFATDLYSFDAIVKPGHIVGAALTTLFFVVIAQAAAYGKIRRLDFIESLKSRLT